MITAAASRANAPARRQPQFALGPRGQPYCQGDREHQDPEDDEPGQARRCARNDRNRILDYLPL